MIRENLRKIYNWKNRIRLMNKQFTLISSNCIGGCICHDLNQQFRSPFVNICLDPKDFLKYCENMKYFNSCELTFVEPDENNHPVALLGEIKICFRHYETEDDAISKWESRKVRINYDNIFILFTDRDGCTYDDLVRFEKLPFKNKIAFTHKKYLELKHAFYISGFENQESVGALMNWVSRFSPFKYYDRFDYVSWFNGEKEK